MVIIGIDAKGTFKSSGSGHRSLIESSLMELQPPSYRYDSRLYVQYYEIGSEEESLLMKGYGGDDARHKIYQELDSRRFVDSLTRGDPFYV